MNKNRFIKICRQILNDIIITDYNSRSYVCKLLIGDKLTALLYTEHPDDIKRYEEDIKELFYYNFNIFLKISID